MKLTQIQLRDFRAFSGELNLPLIGLDLNNRLPLLELLRTQFPRHQIVLLTHDLVEVMPGMSDAGDSP